MQLHTVLFNVARRGSDYDRLAAALEASVAEYSPSTPITVHRIESDDTELTSRAPRIKATYGDNARKTLHHFRIVQAARDGELLCLMDCDTMVLGDLSPVAALDFDLAYTTRPPESSYPFNSGVVFVRAGERTRDFYAAWLSRVMDLMTDAGKLARGRIRYGGINQCGLGLLLEEGSHGLSIKTLPCPIWNCENTSWRYFDENTKIVHLVPPLRQACLRGAEPTENQFTRNPQTSEIRRQWVRFDRQNRAVAV